MAIIAYFSIPDRCLAKLLGRLVPALQFVAAGPFLFVVQLHEVVKVAENQ